MFCDCMYTSCHSSEIVEDYWIWLWQYHFLCSLVYRPCLMFPCFNKSSGSRGTTVRASRSNVINTWRVPRWSIESSGCPGGSTSLFPQSQETFSQDKDPTRKWGQLWANILNNGSKWIICLTKHTQNPREESS